MGNWANLPLDLVYIIEENLSLYIDKVRFSALNLEWHSHLSKLPDHRLNQIHFLLHPLKHEEEATHRLFNPIDSMVYKLYVPELNGKSFKGSSYGWIIATEEIDTGLNDIYLINPLTRAQVKLPPRTEFSKGGTLVYRREENKYRLIPDVTCDYEFDLFCERFTLNEYHMKILLSTDPNDDECVVIATFEVGVITWCRCNGEKWTRVRTAGFLRFIDIVYSKGYLYALTNEGRVIRFENIGTELEVKSSEITTAIPIPIRRCSYLRECSDGSLIVAARHFLCRTHLDREYIYTKGFKVYKLISSPDSSWVEVKSIGDDVLFVGFGSVRLIPSTSLAGFEKNHIYFYQFSRSVTDKKNKNVHSYLGDFSLEDGTMKLLRSSDFSWPRTIFRKIVTAVEITGKYGEIRMNLVDEAGEGRFDGCSTGESVVKNGGCGQKRAHFEEEEDRKTKASKI